MTHDLLSALPTTWIGLVALLILALAPVLTAAIPIILHRVTRQKVDDGNTGLNKKLDTVKATVEGVNKQVTNGQTTLMREDLTEGLRMMKVIRDHVEKLHDEHIVGIHSRLDDIGRDLGRIRDDISEERSARRRDIEQEGYERQKLEQLVRTYHPERDNHAAGT